MDLIALSGRGGAGKTTLAKALYRRGYLLIDFDALLKTYVKKSLESVGVSRIDMGKGKKYGAYRDYERGLAELMNFYTDSVYTHQALQLWADSDKEKVVFDSVRTVEQWRELRRVGFVLVEVVIERRVLERRGWELSSEDQGLVMHAREMVSGAGNPYEIAGELGRMK